MRVTRLLAALGLACAAASAAALRLPAAAAAAAAAPAAAAATAGDFTAPGPCATQLAAHVAVLPSSTGCKLNECLVKVYVTTPSGSSSSSKQGSSSGAKQGSGSGGGCGCPAGPYPVVWLFKGFGARAQMYTYLADRIASHGYAVVQYDVTAMIVTDAVELKFQGPIKATLSGDATLKGALDWGRQAAVGHSRGGKLAALTLAQNPSAVTTAVLIDPVDNTMFSPEGPDYPSAAKALAALSPRAKAAVIGAGVTGMCNPAEANYATFYAQLAPGSWLETIAGATHTDFIQILGNVVPLPPVCGKGAASEAAVQSDTAATTTAWLEATFRGADTAAFQQYISQQAGVQFSVKA